MNKENLWQIYQFKGALNQWNVLDQWEDLFANVIIDSILPDEEDLTKSLPDKNGNSYLSLKNREYKPEDFSGLGRVILRKNMVEVEDSIYGKVKKNVLYQGMFTQSNTVYEIRYDFDLNNQTITIPEGCILDFQGGSFSNGSLYGNKTSVYGENINKGVLNNIIMLGTWNIEYVSVKMFGAVGDGSTDDTSAIQNAINFASHYNSNKKVFFPSGTYIIYSTLNLDTSIILEGNGGQQNLDNSLIKAGAEMDDMITSDIDLSLSVSNLSFHGGRTESYYSNGEFNYEAKSLAKNCINSSATYGYTYSKFENVYFTQFDGYAIMRVSYGSQITKCQVKRCGYGIHTSTANCVSIFETEFNLIGYVALNLKSSVFVRSCIFDVTGQPPIYMMSCYTSIIEGCYFEGCCRNGIYITANNVLVNNNRIRCAVFCTGANNNITDGNETWKMHRLYSVNSVSINNNDIDWLDDVENKYFVVAASMNNSEIKGNTFRADNFISVLGVPGLDEAYVSVANVEISKNSYEGKLLKKISFVNGLETIECKYGAINITTSDAPTSYWGTKNLANYLFILGYNWDSSRDTFIEQNKKYLGNRVFKNETENAERLAITRERYEPFQFIGDTDFNGFIVSFVYYTSKDGEKWSRATYCLYVGDSETDYNPRIFIDVAAGTYITIPEIRLLGEPYIHEDYSPMCVNNKITPPPGLHFKQNTKIRVEGEASKYIECLLSLGDGQTLIMPKIVSVDKSEVEALFEGNNFNGVAIFDTITNKFMCRNNNTWVDAAGIDV